MEEAWADNWVDLFIKSKARVKDSLHEILNGKTEDQEHW